MLGGQRGGAPARDGALPTLWKKWTVSMSSLGAKLTRLFLWRCFLCCSVSSSRPGEPSRLPFRMDDGVRFILPSFYHCALWLR